MNNVLQLKGSFSQEGNSRFPGDPTLRTGKVVNVENLKLLIDNLNSLKQFWEKENIIPGAIVSVFYDSIVPKSSRIKSLLSSKKKSANRSIIGARYSNENSPKHIITHYISLECLDDSIDKLEDCINILNKQFNGKIDKDTLSKVMENKIPLLDNMDKKMFGQIIVDSSRVEKFGIFIDDIDTIHESIITLYDVGIKSEYLLSKIGIDLKFNRVMDNTTVLLSHDDLELLKQKAPYLISMAVTNINELSIDDFESKYENDIMSIPSPKNEPTIGVIDTLFDENVYFSEWVEVKNMLPDDIPTSPKDYKHGTAVTSIIVDGPSFNKNLDDGCGRFKVRHFAVAAGKQFNSFSILRNITEIVSSNKDIKVWNLSLGSNLEINLNSISPEAAILDKIQFENDVIFVVAGTNKQLQNRGNYYIGSPADSINSLVVNSVNFNNEPASYSRRGPVLSFFTKPDISYYGGDKSNPIRVCTPEGEGYVSGTSFAAPWISRKMSYLIDILGLNREVAKALIIHSACNWEKQQYDPSVVGHGVVPINIKDIVQSPDDEIRFVISGISEKYDTYNYSLPVPINNDKYPFIAKATLCYFPCCSRVQGVDYTNTELSIQFGRIYMNKNNKVNIKPINNDYQDVEHCYTWEKDARKNFGKWDNVKHLREVYTSRKRGKTVYGNGLWGISLKTKERLDKKFGENLKFGIVISLKELNGINRINEFKNACIFRNWIVNELDIQNRVEIYNIAEEEIDFDM